jgi:ATP-dependent RNA helicase DDX27
MNARGKHASKDAEKPAVKRGKYDGLSRKTKRRKMAIEADEAEGVSSKPIDAAIRSAKKSARPGKITEPLAKPASKTKPKFGAAAAKKKRTRVGGGKGSAFEDGSSKGGHEGMRAQQTKVNLNKKGNKKSASGGAKGKPRPKGRK